MVEDDTANVIGKLINYGQDTVRLNTSFANNGMVQSSKSTVARGRIARLKGRMRLIYFFHHKYLITISFH
jgi:hypothetical protein